MHRMRQWFYRVLLAALWLGSMILVIGSLADGIFNTVTFLMLFTGGSIAATVTVALAEEVAADINAARRKPGTRA